jgi:hypothetical protein
MHCIECSHTARMLSHILHKRTFFEAKSTNSISPLSFDLTDPILRWPVQLHTLYIFKTAANVKKGSIQFQLCIYHRQKVFTKLCIINSATMQIQIHPYSFSTASFFIFLTFFIENLYPAYWNLNFLSLPIF